MVRIERASTAAPHGDVAAADESQDSRSLGRGVGQRTPGVGAPATGYLPWPAELVCPILRRASSPKDKILAIATGSQGEANAALATPRATASTTRSTSRPGDTVVSPRARSPQRARGVRDPRMLIRAASR